MQEAMIELLAEFYRTTGLRPMCADDALHTEELTEPQRKWLLNYGQMWDIMTEMEGQNVRRS
jgi:hypothetical protein